MFGRRGIVMAYGNFSNRVRFKFSFIWENLNIMKSRSSPIDPYGLNCVSCLYFMSRFMILLKVYVYIPIMVVS